MISVPVRLFVAARAQRIAFDQIHKVCDTRIRQKLYCPACDKIVERSEIVKGYESPRSLRLRAWGRNQSQRRRTRRLAPVINLMASLEKSLAAKKKEPEKAEARATAKKRSGKRALVS